MGRPKEISCGEPRGRVPFGGPKGGEAQGNILWGAPRESTLWRTQGRGGPREYPVGKPKGIPFGEPKEYPLGRPKGLSCGKAQGNTLWVPQGSWSPREYPVDSPREYSGEPNGFQVWAEFPWPSPPASTPQDWNLICLSNLIDLLILNRNLIKY